MAPLRMKAVEVLQRNSRGAFTVPAHGLYPYQWLWDSAFIALGWTQVDWERAWQELLALAERLKADALTLMEREGFREYYDPLTGQGRGGEGFSWSAALALFWTR